MSQLSSGTTVRRKPAGPNVYSVLAIVAFIALAVAVGVLWVANTSITGESNPFFVIQ